jgi:hypothetical protein
VNFFDCSFAKKRKNFFFQKRIRGRGPCENVWEAVNGQAGFARMVCKTLKLLRCAPSVRLSIDPKPVGIGVVDPLLLSRLRRILVFVMLAASNILCPGGGSTMWRGIFRGRDCASFWRVGNHISDGDHRAISAAEIRSVCRF